MVERKCGGGDGGLSRIPADDDDATMHRSLLLVVVVVVVDQHQPLAHMV